MERKNVLIFVVLKICLILVITESASLTAENYVDLILDIYNVTRSTSISLLHFTKEDDLSQRNLITRMKFLFLKIKKTASELNLEKSSNNSEFHNELSQDQEALVVFLLTSKSDFKCVQTYTKLLNRSKIINFVIFTKIHSPIELDICMHPNGNPLGQKVGVSLLVKCYENTLLQEWHSINETHINVFQRATWDPIKKLVLKTKKLLISDIEVLNGKVLKAAFIKESASTGNYFIYLKEAIENAAKCKIEVNIIEEFYGVYNQSTGAWSGSVGLIQDKTVDLVIGWFPLLTNQMPVVDFSEVLIKIEHVILIRKPKSTLQISWLAYIQPFTAKIWIAFIVLLVATQFLRLFMKMQLKPRYNCDRMIVDDFIYIFGIFCQQTLPDFPKTNFLKIFYASLYIFSFSILSIYSARFVSKLTILDSNVPFRNLDEFIRVKTHKLIVFEESINYFRLMNASTSPWIEAANMMVNESQLPKINEEAIKMICKDNMALFIDDLFLPVQITNKTLKRCSLMSVKTGVFDYFSLILQKNGPYTGGLNYFLRKLRISGILSRLKIPIYKISEEFSSDIQEENIYTSVTFMDIVAILGLLFGSIILSTIILIFERNYFSYHKPKPI